MENQSPPPENNKIWPATSKNSVADILDFIKTQDADILKQVIDKKAMTKKNALKRMANKTVYHHNEQAFTNDKVGQDKYNEKVIQRNNSMKKIARKKKNKSKVRNSSP